MRFYEDQLQLLFPRSSTDRERVRTFLTVSYKLLQGDVIASQGNALLPKTYKF